MVENGDRRADYFALGDEFALLEAHLVAPGFKFDAWEVHRAAVHAVGAGVAMRMELPTLEAHDLALGPDTVEQQIDDGFSGEVREPEQCHCDKHLAHEGAEQN